MFWLFVCLIVVPILELGLLIQLGSYVGVLNTILLVVVTAVIGAAMLRNEGRRTIQNIQEKVQSGGVPGDELIAAFLLMLAAAFLLTPGFFTDAVGFSLLLPFVRKKIAAYLVLKGVGQMSKGFMGGSGFSNGFTGNGFSFKTGQPPFGQGPSGQNPFQRGNVEDGASKPEVGNSIDGEWKRED